MALDFHEDMLARLRGTVVPPHAKTVADYMAETGAKRTAVRKELNSAVAAGLMFKVEGAGTKPARYWPAK